MASSNVWPPPDAWSEQTQLSHPVALLASQPHQGVLMTNDDLQRYLMSARLRLIELDNHQILYKDTLPRIECKDGFTISVQASQHHYCSPRAVITWPSFEEYKTVEVGFPSEPEELLLKYAEDSDDPTNTVYAYVPVETVLLVIQNHGGKI